SSDLLIPPVPFVQVRRLRHADDNLDGVSRIAGVALVTLRPPQVDVIAPGAIGVFKAQLRATPLVGRLVALVAFVTFGSLLSLWSLWSLRPLRAFWPL